MPFVVACSCGKKLRVKALASFGWLAWQIERHDREDREERAAEPSPA